jgi:hypothetical protein
MVRTRWRLFRLLGIPISVNASCLIILALLTWTLINLFREAVPESSRLLVIDGDHLVGIVSLKDLLRFLNLKLELEDGERCPSCPED